MKRANLETLVSHKPFWKRVPGVLDLAYSMMLSTHGRKRIMATKFYDVVGRPNGTLGAHFRTYFRQVGPYVPSGKAYEYAVDDERLTWLENLQTENPLGGTQTFASYCQSQGKSFLRSPGLRMGLPTTGDRVYPWWALMASRYRRKLFLQEHGVLFDYDIETAKPTLLLQAYERFGGHGRAELPTWSSYVADKRKFRTRLMADLDVSEDVIKEVLQVVVNGGRASPKAGAIQSAIGSTEKVRAFMAHPLYVGLVADQKVCWEAFRSAAEPGEAGGEYLTRLYFALENEVAQAIEPELLRQDIWWVHDGFMTTQKVDLERLHQVITQKTGYEVVIEEEAMRK